ncbi:nitrogen permease regulator of amino acid transport activity 3-domain-containing protein [Chytridium lagenaria]|nr:nitrogen permease regulator of amino acid transport activity 3-domain-containing protein [Chytridium lagenaria]
MLSAVILVCYSSRGHQLVFSYPAKGIDGDAVNVEALQKDHGLKYPSLDSFAVTDDVKDDTRTQAETILGFEPHSLSDILSPKVALCDSKFLLTVDDVSFVGHPTLLNADRPGTGHRFCTHDSKETSPMTDGGDFQTLGISGSSSSQQLTMFNLVFAIRKTQNEGHHQEVDAIYDNVLAKVTAGLKYEQLKRGYIRKKLKSSCQYVVGVSSTMHKIMGESSLARLLVHTFYCVRQRLTSHIVMNSSIDYHFKSLRGISKNPFAGYHVSTDDETNGIELRPNNALLLLFDPEEVLKLILPLDASPLLSELIEIVTRRRVAAHLVYWKIAKVIDVISPRNVYVVSKNLNPVTLRSLDADFRVRIPNLEFFEILSSLSLPRPYSSIFPSKTPKPSTWKPSPISSAMISSKQLRMVIYLVIPSHIRKLDGSADDDNGTLIMRDGMVLPDHHQDWMNGIALTQPPAISRLFLRLVSYFNGRYHTEEIIFRESISRRISS